MIPTSCYSDFLFSIFKTDQINIELSFFKIYEFIERSLYLFDWIIDVLSDKDDVICYNLKMYLESRLKSNLMRSLHLRILRALIKRDYVDENEKELMGEMSSILKSLSSNTNYNDKENNNNQIDLDSNNNESSHQINLESSEKDLELDKIFENYVNSKKSEPVRRKQVSNFDTIIKKELSNFRKGDKLGSNLEIIFNKIKNIRSTSVSVERLFSTCSYIVNKYRNRMDAVTLNNIIMLRFYFNMKTKPF